MYLSLEDFLKNGSRIVAKKCCMNRFTPLVNRFTSSKTNWL